MGLPVIGLFVRGISHGIGVASEAIKANKEQPKSIPSDEAESIQSPSSSTSAPPPAYEAVAGESYRSAPPIDVKPPVEEKSDTKGPLSPQTSNDSKKLLSPQSTNDSDSDSSLSDDEEEWALDDAANQPRDISPSTLASEPSTSSDTTKLKHDIAALPTIESIMSGLLSKCPVPPSPYATNLQQPVILPQRRPGAKTRGFIRAYAPSLSAGGISQDAWLGFLDGLDAAAQASPLLTVVYLSAGIAGFVPETTAMVTSIVVQTAVGAAIEIQKRLRTNSFLDQANEQVFKPRGLYAMMMVYVPHGARPIQAQQVSVAGLVEKRGRGSAEDASWLTGLRKPTSGETYGDVEMPVAAPLVYPALDDALENMKASGAGKMKVTSKAMADYFDRRAQAIYTARNPNSSLNMPEHQKPTFASKFSDPNDPIHNGSIVALVTGGKLNPNRHSAEKKQAKRERKDARRARKGKAPKGPKGRRMKKNILYLMVVNLPSEAELAAAKAQLQR